WLTSRSIKVRPKPCRGGLPTGGPPRSIQSKTRLVLLRRSTAQEISSDPPVTDREPYFAEFVPSSWMIIPSEDASFRLKGNRRPVDGDAIIATGPIGFDLLAHHIDERHVAPLVARNELIGARHGVQPIEEGVARCSHIVGILQRLGRDADDHGQHILHAMIEL